MSQKRKIRLYTLDEIKDDLIGKKGTVKRDMYEQELRMEFLGEMIKRLG